MNAKKVLIIAHAFPPIGGGGVQRPAKFVKYLPQFDWIPIVLTTNSTEIRITDHELLKDVKNAKIYRTNVFYEPKKNPNILLKILNRIYRIFQILVVSNLSWIPSSVFNGRKIIKNENIDIILATGNPFGSFFIAAILSKITQVPFILDYRDSWSFSEYDWGKGFFTSFFARFWERIILNMANHVIVVKPKMIEELTNLCHSLKQKVSLITNGYDPNDLIPTVSIRNCHKFIITFTGIMWEQANHHSPYTFFMAIKNLSQIPSFKNLLEVHLIGDIDLKYQQMIKTLQLENIVLVKGYLPHDKTIQSQKSSDVLLLLIENEKGSKESQKYAGIIPGKIFEYGACGTPILAIVPENGFEADFIRETGTGLIARPNDLDDITNKLTILLNHEFKYIPQQEKINSYSRVELTKKLANVLDITLKGKQNGL